MKDIIRSHLLRESRVTLEAKERFFPGMSFIEIRNWLEENGLDRHMPLELRSTEIAIKTPFGVVMQIRPIDNDQLGMWGGVIEDGETPLAGAVRELKEETGLVVTEDSLKFVEINDHYHKYAATGDQVYFKTWRFVLELNYVPKITTDEESVGVFMVPHTILSHQQKFIKKILGEED